MKIDTEGTYTLRYTAEDECGNVTTEDRTVVVENITYRTVLYTDGTFIINEKSTDQAANEALHGVATNVYDPFDPNGRYEEDRYVFDSGTERPWDSQVTSVRSVQIGSHIAPTSTAYWFRGMGVCTSIDLTNLDTSAVTNMNSMFSGCETLTSLDVSGFNTSAVTDMGTMFIRCKAVTSLDLSSFDTHAVTAFNSMFSTCQLLRTIYASEKFVVTQVATSTLMFNNLTNLVGGAGTTWASSNPKDATYARIDNPPDAPGYFTAKS